MNKKRLLTATVLMLSMFGGAFGFISCGGDTTDKPSVTPDETQNGHVCVFENYTFDNNATCLTNGTDTSPCKVEGCNETDTRPSQLNSQPADHAWGEYEFNDDATCNSYGTDVRHCATPNCTQSDSRPSELNATYGEHNYEWSFDTSSATCVDLGTDTGSCSVCGNYTNRTTEINTTYGEHYYREVDYEYDHNATCQSYGTDTATCSREGCNERHSRPSAYNFSYGNHDWSEYKYNNNAKCYAAGTETRHCLTDGCDENQTIMSASHPATHAHSFGAFTYNDDATCEKAGTETATCTNDGCPYTYTRESADHPETGEHSYIADPEDIVCSVCNRIKPSTQTVDVTDPEHEKVSFFAYKATESGFSGDINPEGMDGYNVSKASGATSVGSYLKIPSEYNGLAVKFIGIDRTNNFSGLTDLVAVEIPDSVTLIYGESGCTGAFEGSGLKSVTIPGSVKKIGANAFAECANLATVIIGDGVEVIDEYAFYGCTALKEVVIPASVKTIRRNAFSGCTALQRVVLGAETVGVRAFDGCTLLTDVTIERTVKEIGEVCFDGCTSLRTIFVPDSVLRVGSSAFTAGQATADLLHYGGTIVYCEASEKPEGWHNSFIWQGNFNNVVWGWDESYWQEPTFEDED